MGQNFLCVPFKPLYLVGGDNHEEAYNQVYDDNNPPYDDDNKAKFSHEAVGGKLRLFRRLCTAWHLALATIAPEQVAQQGTSAELCCCGIYRSCCLLRHA